jgi:hypothetical protein
VNALLISLIRTWTAIIAGALLTWAAAHGFGVHDQLTAPLDAVLFALFTGAYYFVARLAETFIHRYLGFLLLIPAPPVYPVPAALAAGSAPGRAA